MRVLLAFDKFKDCLSAREACELTGRALTGIHPDWRIEACPLADGGEGFAEILTTAAGGRMERREVTGPRGASLSTAFGLVSVTSIPEAARSLLGLEDTTPSTGGAKVAIIEMAAASGLALLRSDERDPWRTTSRGTGELIRAAADAGACMILLGVGGSATHDLGLGALAALGFTFRPKTSDPVDPSTPAGWPGVLRIHAPRQFTIPPVTIACDVTNPLLGARGAAAVYGPQKGLRSEDHARLEAESARMAGLLATACGAPPSLMEKPGAGAAGGIAYGLMAGIGAQLLPGFDLVSAWLDLDNQLRQADLVITGEGRFDDSSLEGKGPGAVATRALSLGKPVYVFAGQVTASTRPGLHLHAITPTGVPLGQALRDAPENLARSVQQAFTSPTP